MATDIIEKRIELTGIRLEEYRADFIGYNSLYGDLLTSKMNTGTPMEVRLHISGRAIERLQAELLANEVEALYTNGPAGGGGAEKRVKEIVSICSIFVPRKTVQYQVEYLETGDRKK